MALTVLDAGVIIGVLDRNDAHHATSLAAVRAALERGDRLVLPASALAEVLVGPNRGDAEAVETARTMLDRVPIEVEPLDEDIAAEAAGLRARHVVLRLPDALVIATASMLGADRVVTTDRRWPARRQLRIEPKIEVL